MKLKVGAILVACALFTRIHVKGKADKKSQPVAPSSQKGSTSNSKFDTQGLLAGLNFDPSLLESFKGNQEADQNGGQQNGDQSNQNTGPKPIGNINNIPGSQKPSSSNSDGPNTNNQWLRPNAGNSDGDTVSRPVNFGNSGSRPTFDLSQWINSRPNSGNSSDNQGGRLWNGDNSGSRPAIDLSQWRLNNGNSVSNNQDGSSGHNPSNGGRGDSNWSNFRPNSGNAIGNEQNAEGQSSKTDDSGSRSSKNSNRLNNGLISNFRLSNNEDGVNSRPAISNFGSRPTSDRGKNGYSRINSEGNDAN